MIWWGWVLLALVGGVVIGVALASLADSAKTADTVMIHGTPRDLKEFDPPSPRNVPHHPV